MQTRDFLAVSAMAALGIGIGRRCAVHLKQKDDWHEYPNLWAAIIRRPSAMISPALGAALAPLRRVQTLWGEEHAKAMGDYEKVSIRAKIERKAAPAKAEKQANAIGPETLASALRWALVYCFDWPAE